MRDGRSLFGRLVGSATIGFARLVTGVRGNWQGCLPARKPRIYFANHASHGDFILVWTVFPSALRATARPVAARDYWNAGATRRFLAHNVFDAVLIDRESTTRSVDPIGQMASALEAGSSLILFPEGTRSRVDAPLEFHRGAANIAVRAATQVTPVYIRCNPVTLTKGEPWYRIPRRRPHFSLVVGQEIPVEGYRATRSIPLASRAFNEHMRNNFQGELARTEGYTSAGADGTGN